MTTLQPPGVDSRDLMRASADYWTWAARVGEIACTRLAGPAAVAAACRSRVAGLLQFARRHSRFYRHAWRDLPEGNLTLTQLPVVTRCALMARFDDWVTDPAIELAGVEAFLADRSHVGERYLDRYIVWKSSGTTGVPGIYVQDADALAVFDALMAMTPDAMRFAALNAWELMLRGARAALVAATGDHFASIASWRRLCRGVPAVAARSFSILEPLPRLVAALNEYRPVLLASYPTMLALLADEQEAGRLRIAPLHVWSGGECLGPSACRAIERAFGCSVVNEYGGSECMSIASGCAEGWLHVNADWVVLEPVDADYRPTPRGEPSRTALLTNLANRTQPIIRYDLGDSVLESSEPCPCGSALPAIRVQGRRDDVVSLVGPHGSTVRLLPLALTTVVEDANVHRFQIVQAAPDRLLLRLGRDGGERTGAWAASARALRQYLDHQALPNVQVTLDPHSPVNDRRSGKLREVIVAPYARQRPSPTAIGAGQG